jgi:rhodanese-related sulfurtransferase
MAAKDGTKRELTPKEAEKFLRENPDAQLVDVRENGEHADAHIAKSKLIPLGLLPVRMNELDKQKPVVFYCAAGGRSGQALAFAEKQGFKKAQHILGGMGAWADAGLPCVS